MHPDPYRTDPKRSRQLPVILSADEIARFLAAAPSLRHRTALMTAYAAGLRVSEVVRLKITVSTAAAC
jgi:site-specific recombinase XerD